MWDLLNHDGDVLVQVAAVELNQIYKNMEKVGGKTYVHPQEDEACWERPRNKIKYNKTKHKLGKKNH